MLHLQTPPIVLPDSIPSPKQEISMLTSLPFDELINKLVTQMVTFAINLTIAFVVFYVGKFIIRKITNLITTILVRRDVDHSLSTFILSLVKMVLFFILIVTVIGILGIETSSFIAIFASAGVAIGMALSGTLQNFAGGVLILLLKPYKIGDYIEAQGFAGYVTEIQIFHTIINTYDNKSILIPNGGLSTASINNWSREDYRRVEWKVAISYGDDVDAARQAIIKLLSADPRVICEEKVPDMQDTDATPSEDSTTTTANETDAKKPRNGFLSRLFHHQRRIKNLGERIKSTDEMRLPVSVRTPRCPSVTVSELGDSSVNLVARAWTHNSDYWELFYGINEAIYKELPKAGIHFPFPQLDVHLDNN